MVLVGPLYCIGVLRMRYMVGGTANCVTKFLKHTKSAAMTLGIIAAGQMSLPFMVSEAEAAANCSQIVNDDAFSGVSETSLISGVQTKYCGPAAGAGIIQNGFDITNRIDTNDKIFFANFLNGVKDSTTSPSCSGAGCGAVSGQTVECARPAGKGGACQISYSYTDQLSATITLVMNVPENSSTIEAFTVTGGAFDDFSRPSVSVTEQSPGAIKQASYKFDIVFSESVTGFALVDVDIINGSVTLLTGTNANYVATVSPNGTDPLTVSIAENTAFDSINNGNTASGSVGIAATVIAETQRQIGSFLSSRTTHLLQNQPDIGGFLANGGGFSNSPLGYARIGGNGNTLDLQFSTSLGRMRQSAGSDVVNAYAKDSSGLRVKDAFAMVDGEQVANADADPKFDIWTQIQFSRAKSGDNKSDFAVAYLGGHVLFSPDILVGALGQVDWSKQKTTGSNATSEGTGWMVGPYFAARLAGQSLMIEGRAAWGQSNNEVSPFGSTADKFNTTRWMASGKISGQFNYGALTFSPALRASYIEEQQHAFTTVTKVSISSQTISNGEVNFGPTVSYDMQLDDGWGLQPYLGVTGVWSFGVRNGVSIKTSGPVTGDVRGKFSGGVNLVQGQWLSLVLDGFYDGIGVADYEAYGGKARLRVRLN